METEHEETDYESPHRKLEAEREDMESRRDDLANEAQAARQDIETKVGDQNVPGAQDEQEEVLYGREAVEGESDEDSEEEERPAEEGTDEEEASEGGGGEGAGYREE